MFPRLLLLFTVIPLIELVLLIYIAGPLSTIVLVIVTGVLGAVLARREGMRCWYRIQEKLAAGQAPGAELIEGPIILLAGAMLIMPGILTDLCGLSLLVPSIRKAIARRLAARFRSRFTAGVSNGFARWTSSPKPDDEPSSYVNSGDRIIDVTFTDSEKPDQKK